MRAAGFSFDRMAKGSHEIWRNQQSKRYTTVPHHLGAMPRLGAPKSPLVSCR